MAALTEKLFEQALDLPVDDRLELIDKLLISTNLPTQNDIDDAWSQEVERRWADIETNKTALIPGDRVLDKVKERFSK